jgi:hypothetical protein
MKKTRFLQSLICLLAVSCSVNELDMQAPISSEDEDVFYATLESDSEPDTKVYLDEDIKILWDAADKISIFNKSTLNQQYEFDGATGENAGTFHRVPNDYFGAGNDLGYICSVYPYQESATISNSGVLSLTLPAEQTYREESFGPGANTMVSITDDKLLKFKNVGGYLGLKFYGTNVSVSSIRLVGNNGESLSGEATIQLPFDTEPVLQMASTAGKSILLNCEEPVHLGATKEEATIFWMVVPPADFTDGFTLLVSNPDGDVFIKEAHIPLAIDRNGVLRISPIKVDMNSAGLNISKVETADQTKLPSKTEYNGRTITVTTPTLDRSHLVLNYTFSGQSLKANGLDVVNGETAVDVTKPVTLTVRNGNYGKNYTLVGCNTGLPVVRITTKGFTLADLERYMNSLQNNDGKDGVTQLYGTDYRIWIPDDNGKVRLPDDDGRLSDNYTNGSVTVRIEYADGSPGLKVDKKPVYEISTKIKGRGNYTWVWDKKPYAFKFDSKGEVLGMPAHKRWILLSNWRDRTLLRNDATFWLSRQFGLPYTVRGEYVELEINGEYRGNYYLCEQIKIDKNRVNITAFDDDFTDLTGGYLLEIDSYWDEINKFHSKYFTLNYMFKEPDEDPAVEGTNPAYAAGYTWMENYINEFEKVLKTRSSVANGDYNNYLDVDSAILFMLLNELSGNRDFFQNGTHSGPHSTYLYKGKAKDTGRSKLFMGPGWDFDYETYIDQSYIDKTSERVGYNSYDGWRGFTKPGYYYHYMRYNADFVARIKTLWNSKVDAISGLPTYIDTMKGYIDLSQEFDEGKWSWDNLPNGSNRKDNHDSDLSFADAITRMKTKFSARVTWMDNRIMGHNGYTAISTTSPAFLFETPDDWPTEE